jgi:hypothetical protein
MFLRNNFFVSFLIIGLFVSFISCAQDGNTSSERSDVIIARKTENEQRVFEYEPSGLPSFLRACSENHENELTSAYRADLERWFDDVGFDKSDSSNSKKLALIELCHLLLTTTGASNGTPGLVLDAPYMWHWVSPNPRHEIHNATTQKKLIDIKPPQGYGKYRTYADIDRRPFVYLSDLFSDTAKYSHPEIGKFHSFGWCSEREMAFSALMRLLKFDSKIIVSGNHCWSEIKLKLKFSTDTRECILRVDNTFNTMSCSLEKNDITFWNNYSPEGSAKWYNNVASGAEENEKVKNIVVTSNPSSRIEAALVKFLGEL